MATIPTDGSRFVVPRYLVCMETGGVDVGSRCLGKQQGERLHGAWEMETAEGNLI